MSAEQPKDTSEGTRKPEAASMGGFVFTVAGAIVVMVAIIALLSMYEKPRMRHGRSAPFCCPDVLQQLLSGANLSVDPCLSIFGYTCYAYVTKRSDRREPVRLNTDPIDGFPKTEAGRAIAAYYRACVLSPDNSSVAKASANALVSVANPPRTRSMTSQGVLELIMDLSLKYDLPSVIEFSVGAGPDLTRFLTVLASSLTDLSKNYSQDLLKTMKTEALETVNGALSSALSASDVDAFLSDLEKFKVGTTQNYTLHSLNDISPEISIAQWKNVMSSVGISDNASIFSIPKEALKGMFALVLNSERRLTALVSALVVASVKLASTVMINANTTDRKADICRGRAKDLLSLWVLDGIQLSQSPAQDAAIRRAYGIVADAVTRKAKSGMTGDDFYKLEETLKDLRVILPSEVVPADLTIPLMTSQYALAELVTRAYVLQARRYQTFTLALPDGFLLDFLKNHASLRPNVIAVPTVVYNLMPLSSATDTLLLSSTVGVYLADSLWQFVFSSNWSHASSEALNAYRSCIENSSLSLIEWPSKLLWLSVQTTIDISKDADWDVTLDTGGRWSVTRGRLFYMTFVHYLMCLAPNSIYSTFGEDVDVFMSAFEDYYRSFSCNMVASKINGASCSLKL
ncbi:hypothetical protein HPB52_004442 [Rhipicephalus sanguineus]|uniref:Uncharacterized protein n=1 Tax=Rhipicephalus sanguineus TaxID=34632 RepID=A0A9D4PM07_RHISA|nr:hypothetical protein HPB52_004442 [Rhipicephalus sanguineus]